MSSTAPTFNRAASGAIENTAAQILEHCLLADGSPFTPGQHVESFRELSDEDFTALDQWLRANRAVVQVLDTEAVSVVPDF
ncbi:hypothetical protein ATM97_01390 [Nocardia sp. MH4]|uniref:hypothetical protein n=1 Tax=Nocardia sp. MH4 TaxID=1768677 RepID=UPI001C501E33|nr:hypothetical protein [Nocardia sp. MH4]MBW0269806.1 hypothetical protein [Nocardia sp. MH4]